MLQGNPLVIRADASAQIGTGHVMRCLALAQAWKDSGGHVSFIMSPSTSTLEERLKDEGMDIVHQSAQLGSADDACQVIDVAKQGSNCWVVVDGYQFGSAYQRQIKAAELSLLSLDDYGHSDHYSADVVLNQNTYADESLYANRDPHTQLLLGARYALLRREFWPWRGRKHTVEPCAYKILVTMGGADPANVTSQVIQALGQMAAYDPHGLEAIIVTGSSNSHYDELQQMARTSPLSIRIESNVRNMPRLMAWADIAISAAGSTCWELAFMGLPTLAIAIAENQRAVAVSLEQSGVAINLGWYEALLPAKIVHFLHPLLFDTGMRSGMSMRGQKIVDGQGAERVRARLQSGIVKLREACEADCRLLWEWANDPDVRSASFTSQPIPWEDHLQWFRSKVQRRGCVIYIALNKDEMPIGQVRYEINGNEAVISTSIAADSRGQGFGSMIINHADQELFAKFNIKIIHAYIKPANTSSVRTFISAGYSECEQTKILGEAALHYIRER